MGNSDPQIAALFNQKGQHRGFTDRNGFKTRGSVTSMDVKCDKTRLRPYFQVKAIFMRSSRGALKD